MTNMDNNYFIDKETFEIYKEHPKVFNCDKKIAEPVAELNKLGYLTQSSCEGHYQIGYYEQNDVDLSFLEKAKKDKKNIIRAINKNSFDCWTEIQRTSIYISFKKVYHFPSLPEGFEFEENDDPGFEKHVILRHTIEYYDENDIRRSRKSIQEEIDKYCNILKNWSNHLTKKEKRG